MSERQLGHVLLTSRFDMNNAGFGYMGLGADDHMLHDELEANAGNFVLG